MFARNGKPNQNKPSKGRLYVVEGWLKTMNIQIPKAIAYLICKYFQIFDKFNGTFSVIIENDGLRIKATDHYATAVGTIPFYVGYTMQNTFKWTFKIIHYENEGPWGISIGITDEYALVKYKYASNAQKTALKPFNFPSPTDVDLPYGSIYNQHDLICVKLKGYTLHFEKNGKDQGLAYYLDTHCKEYIIDKYFVYCTLNNKAIIELIDFDIF